MWRDRWRTPADLELAPFPDDLSHSLGLSPNLIGFIPSNPLAESDVNDLATSHTESAGEGSGIRDQGSAEKPSETADVGTVAGASYGLDFLNGADEPLDALDLDPPPEAMVPPEAPAAVGLPTEPSVTEHGDAENLPEIDLDFLDEPEAPDLAAEVSSIGSAPLAEPATTEIALFDSLELSPEPDAEVDLSWLDAELPPLPAEVDLASEHAGDTAPQPEPTGQHLTAGEPVNPETPAEFERESYDDLPDTSGSGATGSGDIEEAESAAIPEASAADAVNTTAEHVSGADPTGGVQLAIDPPAPAKDDVGLRADPGEMVQAGVARESGAEPAGAADPFDFPEIVSPAKDLHDSIFDFDLPADFAVPRVDVQPSPPSAHEGQAASEGLTPAQVSSERIRPSRHRLTGIFTKVLRGRWKPTFLIQK